MELLQRLEDAVHAQRLIELVQQIPRKPMLTDRSNPLENLDEYAFYERFHLTKATVRFVFEEIKEDLQGKYYRRYHIPPLIKLLMALRFFATGSFQIVVGDLHSTCQSSVSDVVKLISRCIAKRSRKFIKYPTFPEAVLQKRKFFEIGAFPGVVGCVDGTHIKIQSPGGDDAELFRNRKNVFSINVQGICDYNMQFTNLVVRWYGSAHDSRVFDNSWIKDKLEENTVPGILLGDSGYACSSYLITPLLNPRSAAEQRFNKAHIKTRNIIERTFGVWKRKFPCLNMLRLKLSTSLTCIVAVGVLHNICRMHKDTAIDDAYEEPFNNEEDREDHPPNATIRGSVARNRLIATHFT